MRNLSLLVAVTLLIVTIVFAQDKPVSTGWLVTMDGGLNLSQNNYSDNWEGGEAGSMIWAANLNSLAKKRLSGKVRNKNTLKLSFGQTHSQSVETKTWAGPVKSTDLIDFETLFRFTLGAYVDPYAAGRLESQFIDGSVPANKRNFNPMRFTESAGVIRMLIDEDKRDWSVRAGAAFRQTLDRDRLDPLTGDKDSKLSRDGGLEFVSELSTPIAKERILLTSKLIVYKALYYSEKADLEGTEAENYWQAVDFDWENIFSASITEYVMVNLYVQWLYDKEISKAGRFKQTLSLGLTYKFI